MHINREDVVQAALIVERWCAGHINECGECLCPFASEMSCYLDCRESTPKHWELEEFLRTRGLERGQK